MRRKQRSIMQSNRKESLLWVHYLLALLLREKVDGVEWGVTSGESSGLLSMLALWLVSHATCKMVRGHALFRQCNSIEQQINA